MYSTSSEWQRDREESSKCNRVQPAEAEPGTLWLCGMCSNVYCVMCSTNALLAARVLSGESVYVYLEYGWRELPFLSV